MFTNTKNWEDSCPASLMPAVRALRVGFQDAHWKVGTITQQIVYSVLHEEGSEGIKDNLPYLLQLKQIAGPIASSRFNETVGAETPSSTFRAFLNFYQDIMSLEIVTVFKHLLEIGAANADDRSGDFIDWAKQQSIHLIRAEAYRISLWIHLCCDPSGGLEINASRWRNWQAPKLLTMTPAQQEPYDARAVWHRLEAEDSQELLKHFEEFYVLNLEIALDRAWRAATIEAAKQSPVAPTTIAEVVKSSGDVAASTVPQKQIRPNVRQILTIKKHESWKREYQRQQRQRPGKSDVLHSLQIAKLPIADGASPETIRKNMK